MRRTGLLLFCLLAAHSAIAQSKWTYGIQLNQSGSTSAYEDICITRVNGGVCYDLQENWQTNLYGTLNYQPTKRIRFQTGLGLNRMHFDGVNSVLNEDKFKFTYLSLPLKAHLMMSTGRLRTYLGGGIRIDKRLGNVLPRVAEESIYDNTRGIGMSIEALIGLEYQVNEKMSINFEPTYAKAITRYSQDIGTPIVGFSGWPLLQEYPERIGVSLGFTLNPFGQSSR